MVDQVETAVSKSDAGGCKKMEKFTFEVDFWANGTPATTNQNPSSFVK
ncbi:MAG: hypothetical protein MI861_10710 [Pirellulales bacterium]|nr:hypothetical protein [Pirellulales bacterium]